MKSRAASFNRLGGIVSQGLNSMGNVLFAVAVAQVTQPSEYGSWAIAYAVFASCQAIARAVAGTQLLIRDSGREPREAFSLSFFLCVGLSLLASVVLLLLGVWFEPLRSAALPLALVVGSALLQDVLRYEFMSRGRAHVAAAGDGAWLAVQFAITLPLFVTDRANVVNLTLAWGAGAAVSFLMLMWVARLRPSFTIFRLEQRRGRGDLVRLGAESSLINARTYLIPVGVGLVANLTETGALRAGFTLLGLTGVMILGLTPLATVEAARNRDRGGSDWRFLWRWSALVLVLSAGVGLLLLLMPDSWGEALLADNWATAEVVVLPLVVHSLLRGPLTGVPMLLRVRRQFGQALRLRLWTEGPAVATPVAGAALWGAQGAAWGLVVNAIQMNAQSLLRLRAAQRSGAAGSTGGEAGAKPLNEAR